MNPGRIAGLVLIVAAIATGAYFLGRESTDRPMPTAKAERKPLYYKNPMGLPDTSPVPKKDSMGMDYIPVYTDDKPANTPASSNAPAAQEKGRILYYKNPMGLPDTSPVPKKDNMGMDYIPVYANDQASDNAIRISPDKVQKLGVQSAPAELRTLARTIRSVGTIQPDERRLSVVTTKFEGWIDKLLVNATGEQVSRGQPLMRIYAPDLVTAQQEYALAAKSHEAMKGATDEAHQAAQELEDAALRRLKNWDISDDQITELRRSGTVARTLTLHSPADGVVLEKAAIEGMKFMPGDPLYKIADLSSVWLIANVYEQDLALIHKDQAATITVTAYPGQTYRGTVDFVYPTLDAGTRTGKVRIVVANPKGDLKTDMYATVTVAVAGNEAVLTVPESAVIDSRTEQVVLVDRGDGKFEPRRVMPGAHGNGLYEIRSGLSPGEKVVTSANFLIDAESNLNAALKAFTASQAASNTAAPIPPSK